MMELQSFGAVLTFAAELEERDRGFYAAALENPLGEPLRPGLEKIASTLAKNNKNLLRVRQENVTEMILEPISGLNSEGFVLDWGDPGAMTLEQIKETAVRIEDKAVEFYTLAAEKIKVLKEVSRALKMVAKKRNSNLATLRG